MSVLCDDEGYCAESADVETVARYIAARKMGLTENPRGDRLPDLFWQRYQERAQLLLRHNSIEECFEVVEILVLPAL